MAETSRQLSRAWCLTVNNPDPGDFSKILESECVYVVLGRETGESGTPHLQGYIYYRTEKSLKQLRKLCERGHYEIARGSPDDNRRYCTKDGDFEERGTLPCSSKRKGALGGDAEKERWELARKAAKAGDIESVPPDIYLRFYRTLKEIAKDHMVAPPDAEDLTGIWICGPAGSGKSFSVRQDYPGFYPKMANKWWDGYQGQPVVCIDDLDKKHDCLGHHLKIWADRYSFLAETKGGAILIRPQTVIVTSQYEISDIWPDSETQEALYRRFTVIKKIIM